MGNLEVMVFHVFLTTGSRVVVGGAADGVDECCVAVAGGVVAGGVVAVGCVVEVRLAWSGTCALDGEEFDVPWSPSTWGSALTELSAAISIFSGRVCRCRGASLSFLSWFATSAELDFS